MHNISPANPVAKIVMPRHAAEIAMPGHALDIMVIGLGNILLADDGIGVHAVRRLAQADPIEGLQLIDGGTLGFRLLQTVTASEAVLFIDAAELDEPAGAVRLLHEEDLALHILRRGRISAHEAGLVDLLTLARLDGWRPKYVAVLAVQPNRIDWGTELSMQLRDALPIVCRKALSTVQRWCGAA